MNTLDKIKADTKLLEWARYSIRFNSGRANQADDFMSKLKWNKTPGFDGVTQAQFMTALRQIEREGKE